MAKPTAPLLSFGASGTLAKSMVFSKWKGRPYVRRHVIPANPQSTAQTLTRDIFSNLNEIWKRMTSNAQLPWTRFADGQVLTNRNAFIGKNIAVLRGDVDLADFIWSPGAKGGLIADSMVITPGAAQLTIDVVAPTPPTGWAVTTVQAIALADGAPESITNFVTTPGADTTEPFSIVLTLAATTTYTVGSWIQWTKPDGTFAYGPSLTALATTT